VDRLTFEKLEVWQKAFAFANSIYEVTRTFPKSETFGLISQMRRAGVSIAANIAEGASRSSRVDQARFVEIAYGSLSELATMIQIACAQGFISERTFEECYSRVMELCRLLSGFRRSLVARGKSNGRPSTINHQLEEIRINNCSIDNQDRIIEMSKQYVMNIHNRVPVVFARGEGAYLWDVNGKKYLDFLGGIAVGLGFESAGEEDVPNGLLW